MKKKHVSVYGIAAVMSLLTVSCQEDDTQVPVGEANFTFTFESNAQGWTGGFADYPVGEDEFYEVLFEWDTLPQPLDQNQKALKISGNNHSDDLFMFVKRRIDGLQPNTAYHLTFNLEVASDAPGGSVGIGGSPANAVYLKAGATQAEPKAVQQDGEWQINIDKGNQSQGGEDMMVLGDIATDQEDFEYTLITRDNADQPFSITANENGSVWVIMGTDSGFEGTTTLYYNQIGLEFEQVTAE